jgi:acylphosphatase
MASGELFSLRVLISGKVQGVGYRLWTVRQAKCLGLKGWVRNLPDDGVEAVFSGDRPAVLQMVQLCHQGPRAAVVKEVIETNSNENNFDDFDIRY